MSTTMKKQQPKTCYVCGAKARAQGLCVADYQAHHVRKIPIVELIARRAGNDPDERIPNGEAVVLCMARGTKAEAAKIDAAVKAGRIRSRYAFVRKMIREGLAEL
jgi:hypothetical protein